MRIVRLTAENFKRLVAVEIVPGKENTVVITGRNGAGKTSVLDAIAVAVAGKGAAKDLVRPIREGEKVAEVVVETEQYTIKRRWTQNGTPGTLTITDREKRRYGRPQELLDDLVGNLTLDPMAFSLARPADQAQMLADVTGLAESLKTIDARRAAAYSERTETNREIKRLQGHADTLCTDGDVPDEEIDLSALSEKFTEAGRVKQEQAERRRALKTDRDTLANLETQITDLENGLENARDTHKIVFERIGAGENEVEEFAEPDTEAIRQEMGEAQAINHRVRQKQEWRRVERDVKKLHKESEQYTADLKRCDDEKLELVRKADLPVEGLGFGEDCVLYNGLPFQQCAQSEKLRVGIAMAMAGNPQFRVVRVTDASLLDSENMAILEEMAKVHDFQIWLEVVQADADVGICIEEGQIKQAATPKTGLSITRAKAGSKGGKATQAKKGD